MFVRYGDLKFQLAAIPTKAKAERVAPLVLFLKHHIPKGALMKDTKNKERHFGDWLKERREQQNLSIADLAQRFPGSSQKWIRKIQQWEAGSSLPKTRQKRMFCKSLGISNKEWKRVHKEFLTPPPQKRDPLTISETNRTLIAQYIHLLMANQDKILENPEWNHIPLNGFHVGLMYLGGSVTMTLGSLLSCWRQGYLIASGPRQFYILSGGGSPLSGMQHFYGFELGSTTIEKRNNVFRPLHSAVLPVIRFVQQHKTGVSSWSLAQLLSHFGVPIPPAKIQMDGEDWGSYDFQSHTLTTPRETKQFDLSPNNIHQVDRVIEEEFRQGGSTLILHNIQTMQTGEWLGEKWVLKDRENQTWILRNDGLENKNGEKVMTWNREIPALVGEYIFRIVR